jgi:LmbE family N-acetylglucosaminyl deacetylase
MRTLLLAAHADDETLFAAYLAQRHAAHVVAVFDEGREEELSLATAWMGCTWQQLTVVKGEDAARVEEALWPLRRERWKLVIVPRIHPDGHEEHNMVAEVAARVFKARQVEYGLYGPRGVRDTDGELVRPDAPVYIGRKLAAMSCYRSQIADPATRPWFYDLLDMREWTT